MSDEKIIEIVNTLKANDKTMKDNGISDNLWGKAVECIMFLQSENATLRERLEKAVEFPRIRKSANYARTGKYVVEFIREDDGGVDLDIDLTKEEAKSRLAELKK